MQNQNNGFVAFLDFLLLSFCALLVAAVRLAMRGGRR